LHRPGMTEGISPHFRDTIMSGSCEVGPQQ
jgi:hypothetical protein